MEGLPTHCVSCGAYLAGSWTEHKPGCLVLALIADMFPGYDAVLRADAERRRRVDDNLPDYKPRR